MDKFTYKSNGSEISFRAVPYQPLTEEYGSYVNCIALLSTSLTIFLTP